MALLVVVLSVLGAELLWAQADAAPQTTVRLRRVSAVLALLPALLLWVLSRYRQRHYMRAWVAMWCSLAAPLFVFSIGTDILNLDATQGREMRLAWWRGVSAVAILTWIGGLVVLALSAGWVRGPVRLPRYSILIAVAVAIVVTTIAAVWGAFIVAAALWVGGLTCFLVAATRFLLLGRRERLAGAMLIGVGLVIIPINAVISQMFTAAGLALGNRAEVWIVVYAVIALGMHLLVFEDVTYELRQQNAALHEAQAELREKAVTDPLTGCYNRRFFDETAGRELARHQRYNQPLSVVFLDCNNFKAINDQHGHDTGDRVLAALGRLLRARIRQADHAFRWGGDEFLLLLTCDEDAAAMKAREIQQACAGSGLAAEIPDGITLSAGWVRVPEEATELMPYVSEADARMYASRGRA